MNLEYFLSESKEVLLKMMRMCQKEIGNSLQGHPLAKSGMI